MARTPATTPPAAAREVLHYWFGGRAVDGLTAYRRWFGGKSQVDVAIRCRFGEQVEQALAGGLRNWETAPRARLALILLLDQFTRNMHRGTTSAFGGDPRARALCMAAVAKGEDRKLGVAECGFLYLPLEHSESLADQHHSVELLQALTDRAAPAERKLAASFLRYGYEHRDLIARFGRFPHRNAALGRSNTVEEAAFLVDGPRFGQ